MGDEEPLFESDDEDIGRDHIPTVNLSQSWWKPITEERPGTPEPAWSIPPTDLPVPNHNWASALASNYAPPAENSLLAQTGDMAMFINGNAHSKGSLNSHHNIWKDLLLKLSKSSILMWFTFSFKWKNATNYSPIKWTNQSSSIMSVDHSHWVVHQVKSLFKLTSSSTRI